MTNSIGDAITREYHAHKPETQQECCDLAARVSALYGPIEAEWLGGCAQAMAIGLFDVAFTAATPEQRCKLVSMCEAALRKEHGFPEDEGAAA